MKIEHHRPLAGGVQNLMYVGGLDGVLDESAPLGKALRIGVAIGLIVLVLRVAKGR